MTLTFYSWMFPFLVFGISCVFLAVWIETHKQLGRVNRLKSYKGRVVRLSNSFRKKEKLGADKYATVDEVYTEAREVSIRVFPSQKTYDAAKKQYDEAYNIKVKDYEARLKKYNDFLKKVNG